MITLNARYIAGTLLILAALLSPVIFCTAGWFGQRVPNVSSPRGWYRVALYWAGLCGIVADVFCVCLAAIHASGAHIDMGKFDQVDTGILTGVPTVLLFVVGVLATAVSVALLIAPRSAARKYWLR